MHGIKFKIRACVLNEKWKAGFSKCCAAWKTVMEPVTGSVVIYEADVVLSKAEKHVPCGGIS
jgi:hypothetical protein